MPRFLPAAALAVLLSGCGAAHRALASVLTDELNQTLASLRDAAHRGDARTACELIVPVAVAQARGKTAAARAKRLARECERSFGSLELRQLARGLEGQRLGRATTDGKLAHAALAGPGQPVTFVRIAGRWRLLLHTN
jgi:hypothetical protein